MSEKRKLLIITESIAYGGLNLASVRFQKYLNRDEYECAFCVRRSSKGELEDEILSQGIKVYHVPDSELNYLKSYKYYKDLFSKEHYDIVHCHLPFFSGIVLLAAKKCKVKVRAAHAHFSQPYTDTAIYSRKKQAVAVVYRKVMRLLLKKYCNLKIACGKEAGIFLFGKKEFEKNGVLLNNGIECSDYEYNKEIREHKREALNIADDTVVLGHIGQLYSVKNQSFLLDIFSYYLKKINNNSVLLIIGDGTDRQMLEDKAERLGVRESVKFLGLRNDANELYQAMDCFVFPSVHEGFPLTLIEAQASALPCLVSDTVTRDTKINENVDFASINDDVSVWCEKIDKLISFNRSSIDVSKLIKEFDLKEKTKELEKLYSGVC